MCGESSQYMYRSLQSSVFHQAGAYAGFFSTKSLGGFQLPPGWNADPSQGYPSVTFIIKLGEESHLELSASELKIMAGQCTMFSQIGLLASQTSDLPAVLNSQIQSY